MIDDFENMTEEEFEVLCEELLPTQKEAFNLIKDKTHKPEQEKNENLLQ